MENLEKSLAISANFVDASNFELVKSELTASALVDEHARRLLGVMKNSDFGTGMKRCMSEVETGTNSERELVNTSKLCVPWNQFKCKY